MVISDYIKLRLLVARLGEKDNFDWWSTSSLSETGVKFHKIIFPRTFSKSTAISTIMAARHHHDNRIGIKGTFHLFRLPNEIENRIYHELKEEHQLTESISKDDCLSQLNDLATEIEINSSGPIKIGNHDEIRNLSIISKVASFYVFSFKNSQYSIPYFSNS